MGLRHRCLPLCVQWPWPQDDPAAAGHRRVAVRRRPPPGVPRSCCHKACLLRAQVVQVVPGEDAAVVAVAESAAARRSAHRLQFDDPDLALAGLQHFLPGAVALHLGRRRIDAHQLEGEAEARCRRQSPTSSTRDAWCTVSAVGCGGVGCQAGHGASFRPARARCRRHWRAPRTRAASSRPGSAAPSRPRCSRPRAGRSAGRPRSGSGPAGSSGRR